MLEGSLAGFGLYVETMRAVARELDAALVDPFKVCAENGSRRASDINLLLTNGINHPGERRAMSCSKGFV